MKLNYVSVVVIFLVACFMQVCFSHFVVTKKDIKQNSKVFNIYLEENNNYIKSTSNQFPTEGFILNTKKSSCDGGSIVTQTCDYKINISLNKSDKCNLYFDKITMPENNSFAQTIKNSVNDTTIFDDCTSDRNIRYGGENPNNYITFNGELWRVVGVFNNIETPTGEASLVKIMRNTSLGSYSFSSSESTDNEGLGYGGYATSYLKDELNGDYLNSTLSADTYWYSGKNNQKTAVFDHTKVLTPESQALIENVTWSLGEITVTGKLPKDLYAAERDNKKINSSRLVKWTGKVGLIYPSDYGYAARSSSALDELCLQNPVFSWNTEAYGDCKNKNYINNLAGSLAFSITSSNSTLSYVTAYYGRVQMVHAYSKRLVFPSVFLKSNVSIISGDGTSENPYVVS